MSQQQAQLGAGRKPFAVEPATSDGAERPEPSIEEADAGAWPEGVERRVYADSSLTIPGMGERGQRCGEAIPIEFCESCGEPHFGISRCEQRQCPDCWFQWRRNQAEPIVRRLAAARYAAGDGIERRAVHAVVSPPDGEVSSLVDVDDMMRTAYDLMREKGVRGGVAIPHGWRVLDDVKQRWAKLYRNEATNLKLWGWVREQYGESWREAAYWSPHVHILGLAPEFGEDDPDSQDGYVVRRIRSLESFDLADDEGYEAMARVAMYLMSHAAFEPQSNTDAIRWFGDLHPCRFSPDPREGSIDDPALDELSEGAYKVVARKAAEAVDLPNPEEGDGEPDDDPCENCGAEARAPIRDAGLALQDRDWCQQIGSEQQERLNTAFKWLLGEMRPPPGLQRPRSSEEAREALDAMIEAAEDGAGSGADE